MREENVRTIVLYGEIVGNSQEWLSWYVKAKNLIEMLGYEASHFGLEGVDGGAIQSGTAKTIKRSEKKLLENIKYSNGITWLNVCSLPINYKSASFDYNIICSRSSRYIALTAPKSVLEKFNDNELIDSLKEHIKMKNGEIYDLKRKESPIIYARKSNPISSFKTLKIIKTIQG